MDAAFKTNSNTTLYLLFTIHYSLNFVRPAVVFREQGGFVAGDAAQQERVVEELLESVDAAWSGVVGEARGEVGLALEEVRHAVEERAAPVSRRRGRRGRRRPRAASRRARVQDAREPADDALGRGADSALAPRPRAACRLHVATLPRLPALGFAGSMAEANSILQSLGRRGR